MVSLRLQERGILDEVERAEPGTPRIQRLEDDLCVVALIKVDGDHVEEAVEAGLQGLDAFYLPSFVRLAFVGDPVLDPVPEIPPGAGNARAVRVRALLHHAEECLPVPPGGPDLEPQVADHLSSLVEGQSGEVSGDRFGTVIFCRLLRSGEDDLECGQTLLAVDDQALVDAARLEILLIEHDGPEEVLGGHVCGWISDVPLGGVRDVVPKDTPVVPLIPDVGPLIDRDDELDATVEEIVDGLRRGLLHGVKTNGMMSVALRVLLAGCG